MNSIKYQFEHDLTECYVIMIDLSLVLIVNFSLVNESNFMDMLIYLLKQCNCYCGISPKFSNLLQIKKYYSLSSIAAICGDHNKGSVNKSDEYILPYAIELIKTNSITDINHPAINKLQEYDNSNNTEFVDTLKCFVQNERNFVKTANILSIHRNTLLYRINRIIEITEIDLNDLSSRLHLLISFYN